MSTADWKVQCVYSFIAVIPKTCAGVKYPSSQRRIPLSQNIKAHTSRSVKLLRSSLLSRCRCSNSQLIPSHRRSAQQAHFPPRKRARASCLRSIYVIYTRNSSRRARAYRAENSINARETTNYTNESPISFTHISVEMETIIMLSSRACALRFPGLSLYAP